MKTVHLVIEGKVQGVFFRATTKEVAEKLSLTGWVKNMPDGKVEVMATGTEENVQQFVAWCWKGPSRAAVSNVQINEMPPSGFEGFVIKK